MNRGRVPAVCVQYRKAAAAEDCSSLAAACRDHHPLRRLRAPPGYVRSVRVLIDGAAIAPNPRSLTPIAPGRCAGGLAHQRWLWSGRFVYVLVGLAATPLPAGCAPRTAGRSALLTVVVTTVGT